ncbi:AAA family ATPase [Prevotella copri]|uniref:AAA family ATPase n=1 Tax=Segatella copri TaxID=165179 RepID=A0A646HGE4_9BACT|nr:AAA family ATPase [Segatella copri]MQN89659.1 AAA family ATPase [Segatella copri]MQO76866.1 AAA family ATPase [Segatella copri]
MRLKTLYVKGFRNFKEVTVNLNEHSLMIGANDVGKTNLIYALRILLDRSLSDYDYELAESDFFAYEDTNEIIIRAYFDEITEGCLLARLPGKISDDGKLVLQYTAAIDNGKVEYQFYCGKSDSEDDLKEIDSPFYRKYLNLKYISSRREFWSYINKTKKELLLQAKGNRSTDIIEADDTLYSEIEQKLQEVDSKIPQLSYVKNATEQLNKELDKLSIHNREQQIVFDTASTDVDRVIQNVSMTSKYGDKKLIIGGEGRINQIYLSLWASQNQLTEFSNEVSIICIEEPEAYLHPHQQREVATYLGRILQGQVILSSHSPYIVSEFSPNSIIRLYKQNTHDTSVASDGCSKVIGEGIEDFGYRMSVIPAEAFFSDCVILVEGPSEMVFYKTLAKQIGIELDRLNISVLSVDGVSFPTYMKILNAMQIYWISRTDNDIMKVPRKEEYRYAGIERCISFLLNYCNHSTTDKTTIEKHKAKLRFKNRDDISTDTQDTVMNIAKILENYDILLAKEGLEEDLYNSPLQDDLKEFYGKELSRDEIIAKMKDRKAINIYEFLKKKKSCLVKLKEDALALPLIKAKKHIEKYYGTY